MLWEKSCFHDKYISKRVAEGLPEGYNLRPLSKGDFHRNVLDILAGLTVVGHVTEKIWSKRFDEMAKSPDYFLVVITNDKGLVVAIGTLVVERKMYNLFILFYFFFSAKYWYWS